MGVDPGGHEDPTNSTTASPRWSTELEDSITVTEMTVAFKDMLSEALEREDCARVSPMETSERISEILTSNRSPDDAASELAMVFKGVVLNSLEHRHKLAGRVLEGTFYMNLLSDALKDAGLSDVEEDETLETRRRQKTLVSQGSYTRASSSNCKREVNELTQTESSMTGDELRGSEVEENLSGNNSIDGEPEELGTGDYSGVMYESSSKFTSEREFLEEEMTLADSATSDDEVEDLDYQGYSRGQDSAEIPEAQEEPSESWRRHSSSGYGPERPENARDAPESSGEGIAVVIQKPAESDVAYDVSKREISNAVAASVLANAFKNIVLEHLEPQARVDPGRRRRYQSKSMTERGKTPLPGPSYGTSERSSNESRIYSHRNLLDDPTSSPLWKRKPGSVPISPGGDRQLSSSQ